MPEQADSRWHQSGWATYAAIMLFGSGLVGLVHGVWALKYSDEEARLVTLERNLEAWGIVALVGGAALIGAGIGVFYGARWARWTGICLAVLAIIWSVGWAEIQPIQSLIGALIHISVVYALAVHPVALADDG